MTGFDFNVDMMCTGCSGAVDRILKKMKDGNELEDYNIELEKKHVHVDASNDNYMVIVNKLNKARKWVYSAEVDGKKVDVPDAEKLKGSS